MSRIAIGGAALLALALSSPARAGVKEGVEAWSRGDYAKAVSQWQGPAAKGDPDAQFNLAQAYKLGKGVPVDPKRAEALFLKAAQQGHIQASDTYGLMLFQSGRREAAVPWLIASAERGDPRAQYVMGIAHFNGDLAPRDPVKAYALMIRAAASGLEPARTTVARMDQALPLEDRQKGVALAAELETRTGQARAAQLAAVGLGDRAKPPARTATPPKPVPVVTASLRPEPVTAGADFANPVVLGSSPPPKKAPRPEPVRAAASPKPVAPTPASAPKPPAGSAGPWRVQLGAFGVAGNAQALWGKLKASPALAGRQPYYVPGGKVTRLQAGPFASRAEAQAACDRLAGQACIPTGG